MEVEYFNQEEVLKVIKYKNFNNKINKDIFLFLNIYHEENINLILKNYFYLLLLVMSKNKKDSIFFDKNKSIFFDEINFSETVYNKMTTIFEKLKKKINNKKKYVQQIQHGDDSMKIDWERSVAGEDPKKIKNIDYTKEDYNFDDFVLYIYLKFIFKDKLEKLYSELNIDYDFDYIYFELKEKLIQQRLFKLLTDRSKEFIVYIMAPHHYVVLIQEARETRNFNEFRNHINKLYEEYRVSYEIDEKILLDRKKILEAYKIQEKNSKSAFSAFNTNIKIEDLILEGIPSLEAVVVGGKIKKKKLKKI